MAARFSECTACSCGCRLIGSSRRYGGGSSSRSTSICGSFVLQAAFGIGGLSFADQLARGERDDDDDPKVLDEMEVAMKRKEPKAKKSVAEALLRDMERG